MADDEVLVERQFTGIGSPTIWWGNFNSTGDGGRIADVSKVAERAGWLRIAIDS